MTSAELKDICIAAISAAQSSRGKYKGALKAKCPPIGSDAAAAWQAITAHANPYKIGFGHMMSFSDRQLAIYNTIDKSLEGTDVRGSDRDRVVLERLGAW